MQDKDREEFLTQVALSLTFTAAAQGGNKELAREVLERAKKEGNPIEIYSSEIEA